MWKASKPTVSVQTILSSCIDPCSDGAAGLQAISPQISVLSQSFESAIGTGQVHTLDKTNFLWGSPDADRLKELYTKDFAGAKSPGRPFYDALRLAARWCCACGHKRVQTLDHYLPKSKFPALAVTPANLTPMCKDCNEAKSSAVATNPGQTFFHPYYENMEAEIWLGASVVQFPEPHIEFDVVGSRSKLQDTRLRYHLTKFKLKMLYSIEASRLASQWSHAFEKYWNVGGKDEVRFFALESEESSRRSQLNSWQAASWRAFADSDWFCDRGFLQFTA